MSEVVYMFAMSLDGFIANDDGSFDWLEQFPPDDGFGFDEFMAGITGIIMGRETYDVICSIPEWPYGPMPVVVATHQKFDDLPANTVAMAGNPHELIAQLRALGATGRIWLMGGGDLARQFLDAGLLDIIDIGTIPVILGSGKPAFKNSSRHWLDLQSANALHNGAVRSIYRVKR